MDELFTFALVKHAKDGTVEFVERFMKEGGDVNALEKKSGWNALHTATKFGHHHFLKILLKNGANVNAVTRHRKQTPLHSACLFHQFDCVKLLVDAGCNVNVKDWKNMPPIIYAMDQEEGPSIKDFLIEHGSVQINYDWMMGNMGMMEFDLGNGISGFSIQAPSMEGEPGEGL